MFIIYHKLDESSDIAHDESGLLYDLDDVLIDYWWDTFSGDKKKCPKVTKKMIKEIDLNVIEVDNKTGIPSLYEIDYQASAEREFEKIQADYQESIEDERSMLLEEKTIDRLEYDRLKSKLGL